MRPDQNSVERIRRHEVTRALKKVNLSPEDQEAIDSVTRSSEGSSTARSPRSWRAPRSSPPSGIDQARKYRTRSKGTEVGTNRPEVCSRN